MRKNTEIESTEALYERIVQEERKERFRTILRQRTQHLALVLEDVYQPHNAGAVIRTAECFGVQNIHIVENRNTFKVEKSTVSMGAKKWVSQHYWRQTDQDNTTACLLDLKQRGYRIVVTVLEPGISIPLSKLPLTEPIALVIGAEKEGISQIAQDLADYKIMIPMYGLTQSLNLSVCVGICLYEIINKLKQSDMEWQLPEKSQNELYVEWLRKSVSRPDRYPQ